MLNLYNIGIVWPCEFTINIFLAKFIFYYLRHDKRNLYIISVDIAILMVLYFIFKHVKSVKLNESKISTFLFINTSIACSQYYFNLCKSSYPKSETNNQNFYIFLMLYWVILFFRVKNGTHKINFGYFYSDLKYNFWVYLSRCLLYWPLRNKNESEFRSLMDTVFEYFVVIKLYVFCVFAIFFLRSIRNFKRK